VHDKVERGSFPGATANNKRPHPLAFVPESTPERNNALDYRSRMRYRCEKEAPHKLRVYEIFRCHTPTHACTVLFGFQ
jgi:hypothetical protein